MADFSSLFRPIDIGSMTAKNRIVMAPMGTNFWAEDGLVTEKVKAYYEARARGGAGMIIIDNASVDFYRGMHRSSHPTIDTDLALPGLAELAQVIQKYGAKAVVQVNHSGRIAKSKLGGFQPVGPSPVPLSGRPSLVVETPKELSVSEIHEIAALFARAIARAQKAGFDGVEIHAAHHYLISQFLSPFCNKRRDQYGGSLDNRARFLVEVLTEARKLVGRNYPLWCRINGQELGAPGLTLGDSQEIAKILQGLVDALSVSAYGYERESLAQYPDTPGALLPLASAIKKTVTVPVIAVGRLTPLAAEQAIREGKADIAAIGRGLIADPDLPNKVREGKPEDVRPCIACFHCNDVRTTMQGSPLVCSVNGAIGREGELDFRRATQVKKVAIIGGGPAGMEAARVLALRGHQPILLEKESRLGGQVNLAMAPPHKSERIGPLLTWFLTQLNKLSVEVRLNTEAGPDTIREIEPDLVILATGAVPIIPRIPGIGKQNVVTAMDILAERADAGRNTVIIGGGSIGCETAEFLHERGKQVTVIEMLPELAKDLGVFDRFRMLNRITALPITFFTSTKCRAIEDSEVVVSNQDKERTIPADTVILAVGMQPNNSLFPILRTAGFETRMAGDCWHSGKIAQAVLDGLRLGSIL